MNSDNTQQRLTFGLAVFVCAVWFLIHNVSNTQKNRLSRRLKGKFSVLFSECLDYPHLLPGSEINSGYAGDRR